MCTVIGTRALFTFLARPLEIFAVMHPLRSPQPITGNTNTSHHFLTGASFSPAKSITKTCKKLGTT
jgi:hypothetical protein